MILMADSADHSSVRHNIFRQCHSHVSGITDVVDVGSCHLALQCDAFDRIGVRTFLRSSDRCDRQLFQAVCITDQFPHIFGRDARHGSRCRQQNDIGSCLCKLADIFFRDDVLAAFADDTGGMHFPGCQHDLLSDCL